MQLELDQEEIFALLNLLTETIEADRYPLSPRIRAKFGDIAPPDPPAARSPTPEERDPTRAPRQGRRPRR